MKVSKLIAELSKYPDDYEVRMQIDCGMWRNVTKVGEAMFYRAELDDKKQVVEIKFCGIQ